MDLVRVIEVRKSNGDLVPFDFQKLKVALLRSGAKKNDLDRIVEEVFFQVYDGISTKRIYQLAYEILKKESVNAAGRYRLKKAIFDLGPSGYPFEKFVGRLFENRGYKAAVGQVIQGQCVTHEVDVVAENDNELIVVECKFHHQQGRKSDVKVALYVKSRFDDLKKQFEKEGRLGQRKFTGYIATNTRFTDDAIQYATCSGMKILAWDYPTQENLQEWIEASNYHLVTALSSASKRIKTLLLENNIVLCRELIQQKDRLFDLGVPQSTIPKIIKEAEAITGL
ncbi:MAG: restriction endonuclease [Bacteroidales bacterium]|nr:restriction endonuclease [Bacteroidales bacterium]